MRQSLTSLVYELPFDDDELHELYAAGKDIVAEANKRDYANFKRQVSLIDGETWSKDHPAEPISEYTLTMARAEGRVNRVGKCPEYKIKGHDANGHRFRKDIYCGLEWCPTCGEKHSVAHDRRWLSWLPKAQTCKSIGYFVIEFPLQYRELYHSKAKLEAAGKTITSVLKGDVEIEQRRKLNHEILRSADIVKIRRRWFSLGLRRWHFFGDAPKSINAVMDREAGVKQIPLSDEFVKMIYNPHLNVLVPGGFISDKKLEYIKAMLRAALNCPELIVNYSFAEQPGRKFHLLEYVTRATFLNIHWDPFLAGSIFGFRNMRSWGKWETEHVNESTGEIVSNAVWSLADLKADDKKQVKDLNIEAIHALNGGDDGVCYCPKCGLPIEWEKHIHPDTGQMVLTFEPILKQSPDDILVDYGAGYYRLQDDPFYCEQTQKDRSTMPLFGALDGLVNDINLMERLKSVYDRHIVEICQDDDSVVPSEGVNEMYHRCVVCSNKLSKLTSYLVVNGVLMPYCGQDKCQDHMKETKAQFSEYGISSRMVKDA
jgi:hypothetical protein